MSSATEQFPRPLTEREASILDFLLSAEVPGIEALRDQAKTAMVEGRCGCGCATIDLTVDRSTAPRSRFLASPVIDATSVTRDPEPLYGLLLFVDDGWLQSVEILYFTEDPPVEFPDPGEFAPPRFVGDPPPPTPPIVVADGLDVSLYRSTEAVTRHLEPWLVEYEYDYVAYDGEGRILELAIERETIPRRWLPDKKTERVIVRPTEAEPTHADELATVLAASLEALGEALPPNPSLSALLDASIARLGYTGS